MLATTLLVARFQTSCITLRVDPRKMESRYAVRHILTNDLGQPRSIGYQLYSDVQEN